MTVAVKTFKTGSTSSYNNELAIYNEPCMKKCQKNSILRLLQCDLEEKYLVTEYCEMGNLHHYLEVLYRVFSLEKEKFFSIQLLNSRWTVFL